jgi:hypothetical protein
VKWKITWLIFFAWGLTLIVARQAQADKMKEAVERLPRAYHARVQNALERAGPNQDELIKAIRLVDPKQAESLAFLLAHMPERDLRQLDSAFLIENITFAHKALSGAPWADRIPREIFLNDVLPYAHVNERRDAWRRYFYDAFIDKARAAGTIASAAALLNRYVFDQMGVQYHATVRPKPDQSPFESIAASCASCTGLSILYADALRAVAIPARLAAIPQWKDLSGNHTWVEVWDGEWRAAGASESEDLGEAWFMKNRDLVDPAFPEHSVYAASFRETGLLMPLVWAPDQDYVWGIDVTQRYLRRMESEEVDYEH